MSPDDSEHLGDLPAVPPDFQPAPTAKSYNCAAAPAIDPIDYDLPNVDESGK